MSMPESFTRMDHSTQTQWAEIAREHVRHMPRVADRVLAELRSLRDVVDGLDAEGEVEVLLGERLRPVLLERGADDPRAAAEPALRLLHGLGRDVEPDERRLRVEVEEALGEKAPPAARVEDAPRRQEVHRVRFRDAVRAGERQEDVDLLLARAMLRLAGPPGRRGKARAGDEMIVGHEESRTAPASTALAPGVETLERRAFARERCSR